MNTFFKKFTCNLLQAIQSVKDDKYDIFMNLLYSLKSQSSFDFT